MDIIMKMLSNVKKTWKFAKVAKVEGKERQTAVLNVVRKGKELLKKLQMFKLQRRLCWSLHLKYLMHTLPNCIDQKRN